MIKIAVTGASGFVGKALTTYLLSRGFTVIPVSRTKSDEFYVVDNYLDCPSSDMLIHLAEEPDRGKVNLLGDYYKRESADLMHCLVKRFDGNVLYVSSAAVYGDKHENSNKENQKVSASDAYTEIKLNNEKVVLDHHGIVVRVANLYGPGMSQNNVVSDILSQINRSGPLKVKNVRPIRDFLYIDDLLSALLSIIESPQSGIFNIGSGEGVSISQLAEIILSACRQNDREIVSTSSSYAYSKNILDIKKLSQHTGWKPQKTLNERMLHLINMGEII